MHFELKEATITGVHTALREGRLTCKELVAACLARIEALDKTGPLPLNAVITVNPHALAEAEALDKAYAAGGLTGPLHGIPVLLKDNVETAGMPTTAGSKSLAGWQSGRDAFITQRLCKAGAVVVAKTNLHEFAIWGETISSILGQSRNPYDRTRTPGGSSGGTGAGLAANFGIVGIGTDTVNSIRSPASACNLCGIRPTVGLISRAGIVPYSMTQDTAGPLARTVEDAARALDVLAGVDPGDEATKAAEGKIPPTYTAFLRADGLKGKRLGVLHSFFGKEADCEPVNTLVHSALAEMQAQGAALVPVDWQVDSTALSQEVSVHLHELKAHLGEYLAPFGDGVPVHSVEEILQSGLYSPSVEENLQTANGLDISSAEYAQRLQRRSALQEKTLEVLNELKLDALIYPHQQQLVCKVGGKQSKRNGVLGSVTGFPAVVVPAGFGPPDENAPLGVPAGVEFLGRPFDEGALIALAYAYENAANKRHAPLMDETQN